MGTKLVMVFQGSGVGWTEIHALADVPTDFLAQVPKAESLARKRMKLCGREIQMEFMKLIDTARPKRYLLRQWDPILKGKSSQGQEEPDTAILVTARDADFNHTRFYLRGVWDSALNDSGNVAAGYDAVGGDYNAFVNQLLADKWGWFGRDPLQQVKALPVNVVQNVDGTVAVTMPANFFPAGTVDTRVAARFSRLEGAVILNGPVLLYIDDRAHAHTVRRIPIFPWTPGTGQLLVNVNVFHQYAGDLPPERVVERKVGRPLFRSAGRRRAKRYA